MSPHNYTPKRRMATLIEAHYLPSIAFFAAVQSADEIILEKHEHYVKQSYRNRCHILTTAGKKNLIVPLTSKHGKVFIRDIRIDYGQKWLTNHWRTIQSAYGKAPFFEHYSGDLKKIMSKKTEFLFDLNYELLSLCLKWLGRDVTIRESREFEKTPSYDVLDLRSAVNLKNREKERYFYQPIPYPQVFGKTFAANLSLIDLIFCTGPQAARIVQASVVVK